MHNTVESVDTSKSPSNAQGNNGKDYLRELGYWEISIEVNDQCNFHCSYCPYDSDPTHEQVEMDLDGAKNFIGQIAEEQSLDGHVLFNVMGEPLMYSGIFELIKFANGKGLSTKLVTNGSLLSKKNIESLIDAGPTLLKISVESLDPASFAGLRGTTIRFDNYLGRVSNMVSAAIAAGDSFKSYLQLDMMYDNRSLYIFKRIIGLEGPDPGRKGTYTNKRSLVKDIKEFAKKLIDNGELQENSVEKLAFLQTAYDDNSLPLLQLSPNVAFHIKTYWRWDDIYRKRYPVGNDGRGCTANNLGIHASGDVSLCCLDYNASTKLGNVFDKSLPEILTSPENTKIIKDLRNGIYHFDACKNCQGHTTFLGKMGYGTVRQRTIRRSLKAVKSGLKSVIRK